MEISMEDRIIELETRLAFQEDTLQQLNDIVTRQQDQIDLLHRRLLTLTDQMRSLAPSNIAPQSEETPPPHY
ncbi:MAG: SlyX family protein [Pseudomonadota bacterium]